VVWGAHDVVWWVCFGVCGACLCVHVCAPQDRLSALPDQSPEVPTLLEKLRSAEQRYEAALAASLGVSSLRATPAAGADATATSNGHTGPAAALQLPPEAPPMPETLQEEHIRDIFNWYANFGRSAAQSRADAMDSFMFMKFAKECPDLLGGRCVWVVLRVVAVVLLLLLLLLLSVAVCCQLWVVWFAPPRRDHVGL